MEINKENSKELTFEQYNQLPTFDESFDGEERLPRIFQIKILQSIPGEVRLEYNGCEIGDVIRDNARETDYYRYHDIFHLAYATILHWSPTFRKLIKHKRKSDAEVDEVEDGGRAIVAEEGLTLFVFNEAKKRNYFENLKKLPPDLIKVVKVLVEGLEVEICSVEQWEEAILEGYRIFREVRCYEEGTINCDLEKRKMCFNP